MKTTNYNGSIIINDGKDILFYCDSKTCTLDACARFCPRYYSCDTVAEQNDILCEYEEEVLSND